MKRMTAGWLLCLALLSACGSKVPPLTEQEKTVVHELTTNMQPHCVGRYLIDLPANVQAVGSAKLNGVEIESKPQPQRAFELEMRRREAELKSMKSLLGYSRFLFDQGKVHGAEHTQYFVSLGDPGASSDAKRVIEAYKWDRGYRISLQIEGADWTQSVDKDQSWVKDMGTPNDIPEKLHLAFDLIDRLQGRAEDVIPTEPGACFFGGFFLGKAISEDEVITSAFALPSKPDVMFDWKSSIDQSNDTLISRAKTPAVQEPLKAANGRILRLDSFVSNSGIKADEALASGLTTNEVHGHLFSLEANYRGSMNAPRIVLDMTSGYSTFLVEGDAIPKASLSDPEAVALWDAVSRTLRPRPNAF
ncbi:T6SS immunity protein Tli4 family protein [Ralstonia soli]|uniref:T6SS immunity protein Tli4 family protein n=1 Tax=Ralstonia soli TaxID=2953896 RepID=A0ABT1AHA4_9RALS|nr:T6SS immunity protein Tli4 family protein [Ralstonia soli]MCO5397761.1 T6SS immunity protein Tli4 family protein [Ralstonia soli]